MKTDVVIVNGNGKGREEALASIEQIMADCGQKEKRRVRLLGEELMCLVNEISGDMEADFWVERVDKKVYLHLSTNTLMYAEKRKEFLDVSTTGKNIKRKGVLGKIVEAYEKALSPKDERTAAEMVFSSAGIGGSSAYSSSTNLMWSMSNYTDVLYGTAGTEEERDDLEKSIIANLADEVSVGIAGDNVEVIVEKTLKFCGRGFENMNV